jgi:hypothetical protein
VGPAGARERQGARLHLLGQVGGLREQGLGLLDGVFPHLERLRGVITGATTFGLNPAGGLPLLGRLLECRQRPRRHNRPLRRCQVPPLYVERDDEGQGGGIGEPGVPVRTSALAGGLLTAATG